MKRRAFTFLAVSCLAIALACAALNITTYWTGYTVVRYSRSAPYLSLWSGSLVAGSWDAGERTVHWHAAVITPPDLDYGTTLNSLAGFRYLNDPLHHRHHLVGIPLWLIALLLLWTARQLWKRSRVPPPGVCLQCGYDLRASPERCPECGTANPRVVLR